MQNTNSQYGKTRWAVGTRCSVLSTQYSVLGTRSLFSLGIAAVLLAVAGCSKYEPAIRTGGKPAVVSMRSLEQVANETLAAFHDLETTIRDVKDAKTAKAAAPKVTETYGRLKSLTLEEKTVRANSTAEQNQQFDGRFDPNKKRAAEAAAALATDELKKRVRALPPEFDKAVAEGKRDFEEARNMVIVATISPSETLPKDPPDSSGWPVWLLCLIIVAACLGFLFRDGLWANAVRLVNVVFSGLLAMNFYEWLAKYLTNLSEDVHSYVAFFDFLALWTCFILFMAIFRAATEAVSRVRVRFLQVVDRAGGIALSLCIGWVMMCFTLASLHTAPLAQYPLLGAFQPQSRMLFGMFAPDREWLGFTKYQSSGPYCRSVPQDCSFPRDFIERQLERRMHIENYIRGNNDHAIRVNKLFMTAKPPPKVINE